MTESEYLHHAEQMEAARKEFLIFFKEHSKKLFIPSPHFSFADLIIIEKICWDLFLAAKGLNAH